MKLYDPFTAAIFGAMALVVLTNPAPKKKVSKATIKVTQTIKEEEPPVDKSDLYTESGHGPAKDLYDEKGCTTYLITSDTTNKYQVIEHLKRKPCDKVVELDPPKKPIEEVKQLKEAIKTALDKVEE